MMFSTIFPEATVEKMFWACLKARDSSGFSPRIRASKWTGTFHHRYFLHAYTYTLESMTLLDNGEMFYYELTLINRKM